MSGCGGTADATDLKSVDHKIMWVRFPPPAPIKLLDWNPFNYEAWVRYEGKRDYRIKLSEYWFRKLERLLIKHNYIRAANILGRIRHERLP